MLRPTLSLQHIPKAKDTRFLKVKY